MIVRELEYEDDMMNHISIMQELYPSLTKAEYSSLLAAMVPNGYRQVAVFENDKCIAICGYWIATKLWCGKYMEIDNFIVKATSRGQGIGQLIYNYLDTIAKKNNCNVHVADAYTSNYKAHRFYYNNGFGPKGFHFVKIKNKFGLR
jgi:GNAT superfamily N-acetyltransferase